MHTSTFHLVFILLSALSAWSAPTTRSALDKTDQVQDPAVALEHVYPSYDDYEDEIDDEPIPPQENVTRSSSSLNHLERAAMRVHQAHYEALSR